MIKFIIFFLLIFNISHAVEFLGNFKQGSFILGKTDPNSKVFIDDRKVRVSNDGYFAFGLDRDRKNNVLIKIVNKKETKLIEKKVFKRKYKIQRIDGLPPKQVTPPPEVFERIKKDNILIGKAREIDSKLIFFKDKFIYPIDKYVITGVYGSQRILNGIPKWPHYGLDFAQKKGTPVKAMNNGIVTLSENDLYYTGGTIIFDHGHGVSTLYMHMDKIFVKVGDHVKKGDVVGTVGETGRATGPHLDIRLNWFGERLDPMSVLENK